MRTAITNYELRITNYGLAVAAMVIVLAGCDSSGGRLKITPERLYAESLLVPANELQPEWRELGRQILACSVYDKTEHEKKGKADLLTFFAGNARKAIKPKGPCSVIAGIAYGRDNEHGKDTKPEVLLTALYLCRQYLALPLKGTDKLPHVPVKEWKLGKDGLAMAQGAQPEPGVRVTTGSRDKLTPDKNEIETPEPKVAPGQTANKPEATGPAMVANEDEPDVDDEQPALTKVAAKEPVADKTKTTAKTDHNPMPVGSSTNNPGSIIYLAANGLLVKISAAAPANDLTVQQAVAVIRKRLADSVALEQEKYQELLASTGKHQKPVKVEQFWDPNADVYWRLLDFAIGGTILKKKY